MPPPLKQYPPSSLNSSFLKYCDFLEELVVDDGIKTLGLHVYATCRELSAAHFDSFYFRPSYYYVYRQSHLYKIMY